MVRFLLPAGLCFSLATHATTPLEVDVELVSLPVAKSAEVQRAKRAVGERPLTVHAMEAELLPDGRVRTRCAPALPDLRQWPQRQGREQPE